MTKKGIVLSVIAVLLAAAYVYFFTDLFYKQSIQIIPMVRMGRASSIPRNPGEKDVYPVAFKLDGNYKLTSIKVVAASEFATNKYAYPLWHLVSDSNSVPIKAIIYGLPIGGMKPKVPEARPDPLQPDVNYVLLVEAGGLIGRTNFNTRQVAAASR